MKTFLQYESLNGCKVCKKDDVILDVDNGERICNNCGSVLEDKMEFDEFGSSTTRPISKNPLGTFSSLAQPDRGLSTTISMTNTDVNGTAFTSRQSTTIRRIRNLDKISKNHRNRYRNLKNACTILIRIKDKLLLSESIVEKAAYYYRKVLEKGIIKGRSIKEFVVASVYVSCRESHIPRTLDEISNAVNANKIFAGKCYRLLLRKLSLPLPPVNLNIHLTKIANKAGVGKKTLLRSLEMMRIIKDNPISCGKDPVALSIGVLYAACLEMKEDISQSQIAKAGGMSILTLRKRVMDINQVFSS